MGDSSGDVKCTDDNDRNNNVVTYYTNKSELYSALLYKASLHSGVRERERKRVLEGYFQRPLDQVDPKLYKDLDIVKIEINEKKLEPGNYKQDVLCLGF